MTEDNVWGYLILSGEAQLIVLFFFGIRAPHFATKKVGIGGIFGFGCLVCNKLVFVVFYLNFYSHLL